jgi:hypothetical protein
MLDFMVQVKVPSKLNHTCPYSIKSNGHHLELHNIVSKVGSMKKIFGVQRAQSYLHILAKYEMNFFCEGMDPLSSLDRIPIFQKPPSNHHKECKKQPGPLTCSTSQNISWLVELYLH